MSGLMEAAPYGWGAVRTECDALQASLKKAGAITVAAHDKKPMAGDGYLYLNLNWYFTDADSALLAIRTCAAMLSATPSAVVVINHGPAVTYHPHDGAAFNMVWSIGYPE